ncbi:MAG: 3-oxoacyl-[acyl-carrier-protein] reductase [Clostridiales bacterium]|jgi:3-oxoacyl-[acyl-carrier protein] reductase|nr:3-oxoacyl-[acyl-carrier-protein] reductase [Clostridiales bacterium]
MESGMRRKNAVITGASQGIGKAIALYFARRGFDITLNYIGDSPDEVISEIEAEGAKCLPHMADVSSFSQAQELINASKSRFSAIDVLVNNAGITKDGLIMRMTEEQFDSVINVNLKGAFNVTRAVSSVMLKQRFGSIVNIASVVGVCGNAGQANYSASKGGLIALTKTCAKEFGGRGVTCNAVAPGFIDTPMTGGLPEGVKSKMLDSVALKKFGKTEDVAEAVYFLASAGYISGQVLNVCGGMLM